MNEELKTICLMRAEMILSVMQMQHNGGKNHVAANILHAVQLYVDGLNARMATLTDEEALRIIRSIEGKATKYFQDLYSGL